MNVGYVAPVSISVVNGGLRTQALQTIHHVQEHGVNPTLISAWDSIDPTSLDLVHIFGASVENLGLITQIQKAGIPIVLSPIFFSNRSAGVIRTSLLIEKCLSWLGSGIRSEFTTKAQMCSLASKVLPNTLEEASLIEKGFSVNTEKITVVPNGVEKRFLKATPDLFQQTYGLSDFILFTGQAGSPRKNVHMLLEVASSFEEPIVIIGEFGVDAYGIKCKELSEKHENVTLIDPLPHDSELLASAYAACKVFVLPSQFETPGIAAMEAALAGARIVITDRGGTQDYFKEHAEYMDPDSISSLRSALQRALEKSRTDELSDHLASRFSWPETSKKTVQVYRELLI